MNNILKMINKICLIIITLSLLLLSFGCKDNNEEVIEKSAQYKLYEGAKESGYEGDYNDFISSVREGGQLNGKIKVTVISDYGNNEFYINEGECFNYT